MRILRHLFLLSATALFLGLAVNAVNPEGIPLRLLALTLSPDSRQEAWHPLSADSAFFLFADGSAVFLDIRTARDYAVDHIPGARSMPFHPFFRDPSQKKKLDPSMTYILYGQEPYNRKDRLMTQALVRSGFGSVYFLRNGYNEWLKYGFPVEKGKP